MLNDTPFKLQSAHDDLKWVAEEWNSHSRDINTYPKLVELLEEMEGRLDVVIKALEDILYDFAEPIENLERI